MWDELSNIASYKSGLNSLYMGMVWIRGHKYKGHIIKAYEWKIDIKKQNNFIHKSQVRVII
jgi:hypothetical protein